MFIKAENTCIKAGDSKTKERLRIEATGERLGGTALTLRN